MCLCFQESDSEVRPAPSALSTQYIISEQDRPRSKYPQYCGLDCKSGYQYDTTSVWEYTHRSCLNFSFTSCNITAAQQLECHTGQLPRVCYSSVMPKFQSWHFCLADEATVIHKKQHEKVDFKSKKKNNVPGFLRINTWVDWLAQPCIKDLMSIISQWFYMSFIIYASSMNSQW